jgi:hypothetical protein
VPNLSDSPRAGFYWVSSSNTSKNRICGEQEAISRIVYNEVDTLKQVEKINGLYVMLQFGILFLLRTVRVGRQLFKESSLLEDVSPVWTVHPEKNKTRGVSVDIR